MTTSASRAVVTPVACVRPPAVAAAAVFDRLPATPRPPKRPLARFAPPVATRSLSASMRYPPRAANRRAALSPSARPTRARAAPDPTTHSSSDAGTPGRPGAGSPAGTSPTVAIPAPSQSSKVEAAMLTTTRIRAHGTRGKSAPRPNSTARERAATSAVARSHSTRKPLSRSPMRATTSSDRTSTPTMRGISPTMTSTVSPKTKPVTIGLLKNSATQPTRRRPRTIRTTPAPSASATV
jgi:hypothetical protein